MEIIFSKYNFFFLNLENIFDKFLIKNISFLK